MEVQISFRKNRRSADMGAWKRYFENNRASRLPIPWERGVQIEPAQRDALIGSLQRFQIGKSREGKHIKRWAAQTGDADYAQAIDLLMAEQHEHARLLARLLEKLEAPLLPFHWSDSCFILLRRFSGLETEIMTVLAAEIIAQRYYWALYKKTGDTVLRALYAQLLHDGEAHIAFHCDYLHDAFQTRSTASQHQTLLTWRLLVRVMAVLVASDHRSVLRQTGTRPARFVHECASLFDKTLIQVLDEGEETEAIQVRISAA